MRGWWSFHIPNPEGTPGDYCDPPVEIMNLFGRSDDRTEH